MKYRGYLYITVLPVVKCSSGNLNLSLVEVILLKGKVVFPNKGLLSIGPSLPWCPLKCPSRNGNICYLGAFYIYKEKTAMPYKEL